MNILAFDTSQAACSICVRHGTGNDVRHVERCKVPGTGQAEMLMPMIKDAMGEAELGYNQLHRIAVTTGPGSFTGVRIGVAAARGFALAIGTPTVSMTTHELLAHQMLDTPNTANFPGASDVIAIVDDARRGQVYLSVFSAVGVRVAGPVASSPQDAVQHLPANTAVHVIGSGAQLIQDAALQSSISLSVATDEILPSARKLADLAEARSVDDMSPSPLYLRAPDAKPQSGHRLARQEPAQ